MTRVVDCDTHCGFPSLSELEPYLEDGIYTLLQGFQFRQPNGTRYTYPDWSPVLATRAVDLPIERLQSEVLDHCTYAILCCYYGIESIQNPYVASALATSINRWLQAEWLDKDHRLLGTAAITPHYAEAAVAEIGRVAADPRFVQVLVPARAWDPYGHQRYWPIWEAAAANDVVVAINYGGSVGGPPTPVGWTHSIFEDYVLAGHIFQTHLLSLIASGIFDRFPSLRFTILESGLSWLPDFMWVADRDWKATRRELPWLENPPSEYLRRHVRFSSHPFDAPSEDSHSNQVLDHLWAKDLLVFGSDFPHSYERDPSTIFRHLDSEAASRIRYENARKHYHLDDRNHVPGNGAVV